MNVTLTADLQVGPTTVLAGQQIDLEEATARDLIAAGRATRVRTKPGADRHVKPAKGPTEAK